MLQAGLGLLVAQFAGRSSAVMPSSLVQLGDTHCHACKKADSWRFLCQSEADSGVQDESAVNLICHRAESEQSTGLRVLAT